MIGEYTQSAYDDVFALLENDCAQIWADIEQIPTDTAADLWRKKLEQILCEYMHSSRFSLMRILHNRVLSQYQSQSEADRAPSSADALYADETCFKIQVHGQWVTFTDISMAHAETLTPGEHLNYMSVLLEIAEPAPESDPLRNQRILSRAWFDEESANLVAENLLSRETLSDPKKLQKERSRFQKENKRSFGTLLSREEAFQVGHILNFSLEEMEWFLLHVLDTEDGFRMTKANDLIEVYCFQTNASCETAEKIKQAFSNAPACEDKPEETVRNDLWTRKMTSDLFEKIEDWKWRSGNMDDCFLDWLKDHAAGLDVPSHTATRLYRNLAVSAYRLALGTSEELDDGEITDYISKLIGDTRESEAVHTDLYDSHGICDEKCQTVAKRLLLENKERANSKQPDNSVPWAVITTCTDGELSSSYGVVNRSRTRVAELLLGKADVEKGDMLFLLWFILNIVWYDVFEDDVNALCCRVLDLKDSAAMLLDAAGLPAFYVPHLMEQSMILSIIYGGKCSVNPTEVYEQCLQSVKKTRNRKSKPKENAPGSH